MVICRSASGAVERRNGIRLREQVPLGEHHQVGPRRQLLGVEPHLAAELVVHLLGVVGVERHQEGEDPGPLDMLEELEPQSLPLVGPFDDAGNVGHHERPRAAELDDAEIGLERREGIVGDLGARGAEHREQRALAGVRLADQAHVGDQLEHELELPLLALLARLPLPRRLVRRRGEARVAPPAPAAARHAHRVAVVEDFRDQLAGGEVPHHRAGRHRQVDVGGGAPVFVLPLPWSPRSAFQMVRYR